MTIDVAILGATGLVGQKVIALLKNHEVFRIRELVASDKRCGNLFKDACIWREPLCVLPKSVENMRLIRFFEVQSEYIISCLPTKASLEIEPVLAQKGKIIFSNASSFRLDPCIPLIVPEINSHHLSLLGLQSTKGKIIKNPNCCVIGITLALAPLLELSPIEFLNVVTMQSISGAGYPGIPSMDILGNIVPYIKEEEEKIIAETKRLFNHGNSISSFLVQVHRVPVLFGHSISLQICFKNSATLFDIYEKYRNWNCLYENLYVLHDVKGHPQVAKDLTHDDMRIHIGHCQQGESRRHFGLVILFNNLVRGAAGAILSNMENFLGFQREMLVCQRA